MNNFSFLPQTRSSADAKLAWYGHWGGGQAGRRAGTKRIFTHFLCSSTQSTSHQMAILGSWSTHTHQHTHTHMHNADSVAHASIIRRVVCVGFQQALPCEQMKEKREEGEGGLATLPWQFAIGNWQLAFFVALLNLVFFFLSAFLVLSHGPKIVIMSN